MELENYPSNKKFPPNTNLYGYAYHGYKNEVYETFFYDFAVQGYDLQFSYISGYNWLLNSPTGQKMKKGRLTVLGLLSVAL